MPNLEQDKRALYNGLLDQIEKEFDLTYENIGVAQHYSTGVLAVDLVTGGLEGGMHFSVAGEEQSAKSTLAMHTLGSAIRQDVPIIIYRDAEGSVDGTYTTRILHINRMADIIGERNSSGKYIIPPRVRYYTSNLLEPTFDSIVKVLNRLPDKYYYNGQWYLVLDPRDKRTNAFAAVLGKPDAKLKQRTGKLWFPEDNPAAQCIIFIDSYASLVSESVDDKEEQGGGLLLEPRLFSTHLRRIAGKLKRKSTILFGVNQLRVKPMVIFGPSQYEPGGNALKHYSTCRNRLAMRSTPQEWRGKDGNSKYAVEPSVEGNGVDYYAYKYFSNVKNKHATPFGNCWLRVWVKDHTGFGRGIDPVFDAYQFLTMTGLAERSKGAIVFKDSNIKPFAATTGKVLPWLEFKRWVLGSEVGASKALKAQTAQAFAKLNMPQFNLLAVANAMIKNGKAMELMHLNAARTTKSVPDLEG